MSFGHSSEPQACPHTGSKDLRILACGSILVAQWDLKFAARADEIEIIDVLVTDVNGERRPLGFYLHELEDVPAGLRLVFGFQRPAGSRLQLRVDEVTVVGETGFRIIRPGIAAEFRLSA